MPRIIGAKRNEMIFEDHLSGDKLALYYRMPTTKEREDFLNMAVRRKGNKVTFHHTEARLTYGLKILVGIRDGDFVRQADAGSSLLPMSSDPNSPDYCADWKQSMEDGCADLIMALAGHVFDGTPRLADAEEEDVSGE